VSDVGGGGLVGSRAVPVVEIGYRSAGALLMAYVTQIAKGELFIESPALPPVGTPLSLRLAAPPATTLALEGTVARTRESRGPGAPAGMTVAIVPPSETFGAAIDRLSATFAGFRVLLGTTEAAPRAILGRYLRSILTCTIVDLEGDSDRALDLAALDLAVIDLDSSGPRGFELGERLRQRPRPAPVLALAHLERDRALSLRLGFEEALPNPPAFADLDGAVRRCLARPATIHHATKYGTLKGYG
jgi:CheY-like chemotaxis protein